MSWSPGLYQSAADENLPDVDSQTEDLYQGPHQDEGLTQHLLLGGRGCLASEDLPEYVGIIDDGHCDGHNAADGDGQLEEL